jgi:hypothetical protein
MVAAIAGKVKSVGLWLDARPIFAPEFWSGAHDERAGASM